MDDLPRHLAALDQEDLVDLAAALVGRLSPRLVERGLLPLARRFLHEGQVPLPGCGAPGLALLHGIAASRQWESLSKLIDRIVLGVPDEFDSYYATRRFRIHYDTSGKNAVDTDGSATEVDVPFTREALEPLGEDPCV